MPALGIELGSAGHGGKNGIITPCHAVTDRMAKGPSIGMLSEEAFDVAAAVGKGLVMFKFFRAPAEVGGIVDDDGAKDSGAVARVPAKVRQVLVLRFVAEGIDHPQALPPKVTVGPEIMIIRRRDVTSVRDDGP